METANTINTTNPDSILYQTPEIRYTLLGGIKLEGLDRLRVTLKIEVVNRPFKHYLNNPDIADLALRQNLDLYNDAQIEKLIRKTADRLEIGTSTITKHIADLTNQLETYRLTELEKTKQTTEAKQKELSEQETQEALGVLTNNALPSQLFTKELAGASLLQITNYLIQKSGVVGEALNRLLMYIIFTSRKLKHPLHIISLGSSGTGKTHLQEKVGELIPDEDKLEITTLSENAFYYFGKKELAHKLLLIEDMDGAESSLFPLRELQSKKRITKTITYKDTKGQTKTITLTVEGPICVSGCTTKERIYEDNANRSFLIYLDETETQDQNIMQYQRQLVAGKINTQEQAYIKNLLQNTQRLLKPITIVNPYAEYLQLPKEIFKPRRTNAHYLGFIEAVTFYHQYQRPWIDRTTGEVIDDPIKNSTLNTVTEPVEVQNYFIETTLEDIEEANKLLKEILLRKSDELTGACRNYFENLKPYLKTNNLSTFTNRSVGAAFRMAHTTVKRYNHDLHNAGLIKTTTDKTSGEQSRTSKSYVYEITTTEEYALLTTKITSALDTVLTTIKQLTKTNHQEPTSPHQPTKLTEPIKVSINKASKPQPSTLKKMTGYPKTNIATTAYQLYFTLLSSAYPKLEVAFLLEDICKLSKHKPKAISKHLNSLVNWQLLTKTKKGNYNYYNIISHLPIKNN
jgi:hypothetical protein